MGAGPKRRTPRHSNRPNTGDQPDDWSDVWGILAGSNEVHRHREMTRGLGGSQCMLCYGYADDVRHYMPRWLTEAEESTIASYEDNKWQNSLTSGSAKPS